MPFGGGGSTEGSSDAPYASELARAFSRRRFLIGATLAIAGGGLVDQLVSQVGARSSGPTATPPEGKPGLTPTSRVRAVKRGEPTFSTNALVENPIDVGGTYWMPYIEPTRDAIFLASASAPDGAWTSGGKILSLDEVPWRDGATAISAPFLYQDLVNSRFVLFFAIHNTDNSNGRIGFAIAPEIRGPYAAHGSPILEPGETGSWDALMVHEPSVVKVGETWYMAFMGSAEVPAGHHEKVGLASAATIEGPWAKAPDNPIPWGPDGSWNAALMSDPTIFWESGLFWIWFLGHSEIDPTPSIGQEGLMYSRDPLAIKSWAQHPSNPILSPTPGTWDAARCFRGGIIIEDGVIRGTYTGGTTISVLTTYHGGNFRLEIS